MTEGKIDSRQVCRSRPALIQEVCVWVRDVHALTQRMKKKTKNQQTSFKKKLKKNYSPTIMQRVFVCFFVFLKYPFLKSLPVTGGCVRFNAHTLNHWDAEAEAPTALVLHCVTWLKSSEIRKRKWFCSFDDRTMKGTSANGGLALSCCETGWWCHEKRWSKAAVILARWRLARIIVTEAKKQPWVC